MHTGMGLELPLSSSMKAALQVCCIAVGVVWDAFLMEWSWLMVGLFVLMVVLAVDYGYCVALGSCV